MKAILQRGYGSEKLELTEIDPPTAAEDGVLVRVRASSVNAMEWHTILGDPMIARLFSPRGPKARVVGADAAGVVEAVGSGVTALAPGDEVFGTGRGAWGELVAGRDFVRKPAGLSFEQAAALPIAGLTALQAVRDHAGVQPGQKVLVTGAGGGVGTFAVQIARAYGAEITAVTSTDKIDLVRSIGAAEVIDYTKDKQRGARGVYDAIIDVGAFDGIPLLRRTLKPGGVLVLVGAGKGHVAGPILRIAAGMVRAKLLRQRVRFFIAQVRIADLATLAELAAAGKIVPVIDQSFPLSEVGAALRHTATGHARGKVVVTVG
jgi:NADPH:quinone reductase-like Zn-dependent oxidoreductase